MLPLLDATIARAPQMMIECLAPDFQGKPDLVREVALSGLDVFAHNIETVEALQRYACNYRAGYKQSPFTLEHAKRVHPTLLTKSSIMLAFLYTTSGPLVRFSYKAGEFFIKNIHKKRAEAATGNLFSASASNAAVTSTDDAATTASSSSTTSI
ncbi:hypothetical protein EV182_008649 [Spiromyces aspiralis]|uniref:Uncharacterized protein n=1 Tax=Spiromyces aspiralis TaxID=68401 RepID=A0ACC1H8T0_9FUNG|nr:hypothetical protein EV182_008649 [Spiromyces aspiralis]